MTAIIVIALFFGFRALALSGGEQDPFDMDGS
jgi:hypothetical protein